MKVKMSITLDDKTLRLIDEHVNSQMFRNKSHAIEFAVRKMLEKKTEEDSTEDRNEISPEPIASEKLSSRLSPKIRKEGESYG